MFSPEVLHLLNTLLSQVTLSVGADDFEAAAVTVATAKREMRDALAEIESPDA